MVVLGAGGRVRCHVHHQRRGVHAIAEAPWQPIVGPFYSIAMLLCGLAAGVTATIAVVREGERSWLVFLPLLPALFVLFLVVGEFVGPPH